MYYIATFYSHFGAMRFKKECQKENMAPQLMPVPRNLSSSCGTCVRFEGPEDYLPREDPHGELEQVVREEEQGYVILFKAQDS